MPVPEIMVIAPPKITEPKGIIANKFKDSEKRSIGLAEELEKIAKENSVYYFNAGSVTESSTVDGIHLDEKQHEILGKAIFNVVSNSTRFSKKLQSTAE
jgi:lysophospholipase L1-like esterase